MSFNLTDVVKGLFNAGLVEKAAAYLGESESSISKAVSAIVPSLLNGFAGKATTHGGAADVLQAANDNYSNGVLDNLDGFFTNDGGSWLNKGAGIVAGLFGSKADALSNTIGNFAGMKNSSAASLLSMAAPAILGLLGKHASENNVNATGLNSFFGDNKSKFAAAMPSGFKADNIFEQIPNTGINYNTDSNATGNTANEEVNTGSALKWLLPLLLLALAAAAVLYFWKGCNTENKETVHGNNDSITVNTNTGNITPIDISGIRGKVDSISGDFIYDEGEMINMELPNNAGTIHVGRYSTEAKLYEFLNDTMMKLDTVKGNWFEFTNVHFKSGGADLTDGSMQQLKNLVAIAKAFPKAVFKIGGYTDSTGTLATNMKVSQRRADAVGAILKKLGIEPACIAGVKGYGPEHPIADNKTPDSRAMNRRVAVNVKAK